MFTCNGSPLQGFTIVEVVIAMLLLMVISVGIALATAGGSRVEGAVKVRSRMDKVSAAVVERLQAAKGWSEGCLPSAPCRLASSSAGRGDVLNVTDLALDSDLDVRWNVTVTGQGVDAPSDGKVGSGAGDTDGHVPDFITVTIRVAPPDAATRKRLYNVKDVVITRTFDGKGNLATGSLKVEACEVVNQTDERVQIDGCSVGSRFLDMPVCPPGTPCTSFNTYKHRSASNTNPSTYMAVRRVSAKFRLISTSTGLVYNSRSASRIHGEVGTWLFQSLPEGTYRIEVSQGPAGKVLWTSHMRPAGGEVNVQADTRAAALLAFRPKARGEAKQFDVHRKVGFLRWGMAETKQPFPLVNEGCTIYDLGSSHYAADTEYTGGQQKGCSTRQTFAIMHYLTPTGPSYQTWGGSGLDFDISMVVEPHGREYVVKGGNFKAYTASGHVPSRRGTGNRRQTEGLDTRLTPGLYSPPHTSNRAAVIANPPRAVWVYPSGSTTMSNMTINTPGECFVGLAATSVYEKSIASEMTGTLAFNPQTFSPEGSLVAQSGYSGRQESSCSASSMYWPPLHQRLIGRSFAVQFCTQIVGKGTSWKKKPDTPANAWENPPENYGYIVTKCSGYKPPRSCTDTRAIHCGPAIVQTAEMSLPSGSVAAPQDTIFHGVSVHT